MHNHVTLIGRIGKDPDVRTANGTKVASFSLATNSSYKDKDGNKVESTQWHNIVAWKGFAELCEKWVKKGDLLLVEGRIVYRQWEDDKGKHYATDILMENLKFFPKAKPEGKAEEPSQEQASIPQGTMPQPDDLPFSFLLPIISIGGSLLTGMSMF